jgi:hypothetical protein
MEKIGLLNSEKNETTFHGGKWTTEEEAKLKDAVDKRYGEDWAAISELVPGRTKKQCWDKWQELLVFNSKKNETTSSGGKWTTEEDAKLRDAVVEKHNGKDWAAISELVPGRTKPQCTKRWHYVSDSKSDETTARVGKWAREEDVKLIDAVEKHNGDWAAISELVLGRTKPQCTKRWHDVSDSKSDGTTAPKGK